MNFDELELKPETLKDLGERMHQLAERLYPVCRSITGQGVRDTLAEIKDVIPLDVKSVASGTTVYDWTVPNEWNIRDAYVENSAGKRVIDFKQNNLHVVSYSVPVDRRLPLSELKQNLHTLAEKPEWVPYRTSYYNETWGFCLSQRQFDALPEGEYHAVIDSSLEPGVLNYGEYFIPGASEDEVIIYTHTCHPSLCNDNLSGVGVCAYLAKLLSGLSLNYSYRFIFGPGTIGSITWLSHNEDKHARIMYGLVLALLGDSGCLTYKRSRNPRSKTDRAVIHALKHHAESYEILDFSPYGYDERQFCSPGINLDVGRLTRSPNGAYAQYHTSADDLDFIKAGQLADSLYVALKIINILDNDTMFVNLFPKGEPQLGKRGLYSKTGGKGPSAREYALLWVINLSDGNHSLLDIAERSKINFEHVCAAAKDLLEAGLLEKSVMN